MWTWSHFWRERDTKSQSINPTDNNCFAHRKFNKLKYKTIQFHFIRIGSLLVHWIEQSNRQYGSIKELRSGGLAIFFDNAFCCLLTLLFKCKISSERDGANQRPIGWWGISSNFLSIQNVIKYRRRASNGRIIAIRPPATQHNAVTNSKKKTKQM